MRILWVKMGGLWPATTGGRVRSLQLLSHLSRRHSVTLVTTHATGDDPDGLVRRLGDCQRVISVPHALQKFGSAAFPITVARSWFSALPVDLWKWRVPEVRHQVSALLEDASIDLCVADFLVTVSNVPLRGPVPVVLFEHNVEYLIWQRLASLERRPLHRALLELEWRKLRHAEAAACADADLTVAVSEHDRQRLLGLAPRGRLATIPTGVDTSYFRSNGRCEIPSRLVFTGSMDWHPNEDAVIYFSKAILPLIRTVVPDVSFVVVGRHPSRRVWDLAAATGVVVTGAVDDVRPYIDEAAVYVVPMRGGSGTRLKLFEALAMAKAVVSTSVGAEGLSITPGVEFAVADDPDDFAQTVVSLIQDPDQRRALGQAGRTLVETHHSWEQVARHFENCCETAVAEHRLTRRVAASPPQLPRTGPVRS